MFLRFKTLSRFLTKFVVIIVIASFVLWGAGDLFKTHSKTEVATCG